MFSGCISGVGSLQRVDVAPGVALLRLDRPERLNALDTGLLSELVQALERVSEVRSLVFQDTSFEVGLSGLRECHMDQRLWIGGNDFAVAGFVFVVAACIEDVG